MTRQDDELVRLYREASAQEDARPGIHVRDAVRAHAQMLAAAAATVPSPAAIGPTQAAANQSRWKLSALATVALVGLTGLLLLQFERGTPEERDTAFGQRRAQTPAPAAVPAPAPSSTPSASTTPATPEGAEGPARDRARPSPSTTAQKPAAAPPRAEMRERSAMQDESPSRALPSHQAPPPVARSPRGGNAANSDMGAGAAPQVHKALDPLLPRALREAARTGNTGEVESLIGQGAPVNARDTAGRTALMMAALNGHTAAVQKLLALGAQTTLVDGDGLTASQHARRWGYLTIAELIEAAR